MKTLFNKNIRETVQLNHKYINRFIKRKIQRKNIVTELYRKDVYEVTA